MTSATTQLEYELRFCTPAFLGDAAQQGQWRAPPVKAILRQWWRVARAASVAFDWQQLRRHENELFGFADKDGASRSLVRIRLSSWDTGTLNRWPTGEPKVTHPEVKFPVGSELYLGYGALDYDKASKAVKLATSKASGRQRSAIDTLARQCLVLRLPSVHQDEIERTMALAAWFGTIGSRSRNGWGSVTVSANTGTSSIPALSAAELRHWLRPLDEALRLDWPHCIGMDDNGRPLVWLTTERAGWREVLRDLADIKIAFRSKLPFKSGKDRAEIEERHLLGYPVTNHIPKAWGAQRRLANQIRFKVLPSGHGLRAVIVHLPCRTPDELPLPPTLRLQQGSIWRKVHGTLDGMSAQLSRLS